MRTQVTSLSEGILLCKVFRYHRWIPVAARAGVVDGARVWDWELSCETGCGNRATEWMDDFGYRLPGTKRNYFPTKEWQDAGIFERGELVVELIQRMKASNRVEKPKRVRTRKKTAG